MTSENEKPKGVDVNEKQELSIEDLKVGIGKSLEKLGEKYKNNEKNENLETIKRKVNLHENNEKALLIIYQGLEDIIKIVKDIEFNGQEKINKINRDLIMNLEKLEKQAELSNINYTEKFA